MNIVLRLMTAFLVCSFFSLHSMENLMQSLRFSEERYDREIYEIPRVENENFHADYWSVPEQMVKKLMQVLLDFHKQNKPREKGKKNKVLPYSYMMRGMEYCSRRTIDLKNGPGFGYRFFKLANIFIEEYYKPRKKQYFKLMGGKRFRTVGDGEKIEIFGKGCIIPTAVRYRPGSAEERIVTQFNESREVYKALRSSFREEKLTWMRSRFLPFTFSRS